jgi:hypothetical protein
MLKNVTFIRKFKYFDINKIILLKYCAHDITD